MASKNKKAWLLVLTLFLMIFSLSACFGGEANVDAPYILVPDEDYEPRFGVSISEFALNVNRNYSINPFTTSNISNILVTQLMYDTLFELDPSFNLTTNLVTSWESRSPTAWLFYIDTSIRFWDGSTLSAYDVAYSIQWAMRSPLFSQRLDLILGVGALDERLLMINLRRANTAFPALLNIPIIRYGSIDSEAPMGTGPFMINEAHTQLSIFPDHRLASELPIETIHLREFRGAESIMTAFENTDINLVTNDPTGVFRLGFSPANEIRYFATTNMHYLAFNTRGTFFSNPQFRHAMNFIVDRNLIVTQCLGGAGTPTTLPLHPSSPLFNDSLAQLFEYSPSRAKEALEAAGVVVLDGYNDGYRVMMIHNIPVPVELNFIVNNDNPFKVAAARAIVRSMEDLGIRVNLRELTWNDFLAALSARNFDMFYAETMLTADFSLRELLLFDGSLNFGAIQDPVLEEHLLTYKHTDEENRQRNLNVLLQYIGDTAPIVPILFEMHQVITHRGVASGLRPTQANIFYNFHEWNIRLTEPDQIGR